MDSEIATNKQENDNQQEQQHQQEAIKLNSSKSGSKQKITHRSQSSPSSLTTHKFGLKPTPSPPRLIIDHNTGDIVESYPDQPVYLRTYQPLELAVTDLTSQEDLNQEDTSLTDNQFSAAAAFDDSLAHPNPAQLNKRQLEEYNRFVLAEEQQQFNDEDMPDRRGHNNQYRPILPPPHIHHNQQQGGRVYFAPPAISSSNQFGPGGHLFNQQDLLNEPPLLVEHQIASPSDGQPRALTSQSRLPLSGAHNASFKRALNKLQEDRTTDIAILPSDDVEAPTKQEMKITATSGSKSNALLYASQKIKQQQPNSKQKQLQQHSTSRPLNGSTRPKTPNIEEFKLYNLGYNFRQLLVCLVSIVIIYLLVFKSYISTNCLLYNPTTSYISIITSNVNLICILVFTLFWYCNDVTKTLYANLSSSAFIITIYSILVAINLSMAVVFFFINTCHYEKLKVVKANQAHFYYPASSAHQTSLKLAQLMAIDPDLLRAADDEEDFKIDMRIPESLASQTEAAAQNRRPKSIERRHSRSSRELPSTGEDNNLLSSGPDSSLEDLYATSNSDFDTQLQHLPMAHSTPAVQMSPFEAAWEYFKEQWLVFKRKFNQFLYEYDLRFIGTLHALCAICLQYMAIKVAVVRSYFCSPVGTYV